MVSNAIFFKFILLYGIRVFFAMLENPSCRITSLCTPAPRDSVPLRILLSLTRLFCTCHLCSNHPQHQEATPNAHLHQCLCRSSTQTDRHQLFHGSFNFTLSSLVMILLVILMETNLVHPLLSPKMTQRLTRPTLRGFVMIN